MSKPIGRWSPAYVPGALALLCAVGTACPSDESSPGSAEPIAEADYPGRFAEAQCEALASCGCVHDLDRCIVERTAAIESSAGFAGAVYDAACAGERVARLTRIEVECQPDYDPANATIEPSCRVYSGTKSAGEPCEFRDSPTDCSPGHACVWVGTGDDPPQFCFEIDGAGLGETCYTNWKLCGPGLTEEVSSGEGEGEGFWGTTNCTCVEEVPADLKAEGEPCTVVEECAENLFCRAGTCYLPREIGESCEANDECRGGSCSQFVCVNEYECPYSN